MVRAFIGLGSNVGDRLENLRRAVVALDGTEGIEVVRRSSVYDTDPVGPPQPNFLNAVTEVRTSLASLDLLASLKSIEAEIGRSLGERWGPRVIDLDLLLYGDEYVDEPGLEVPHPQMKGRAFVLVPLAEIAPEIAAELADAVDRSGVRLSGRL